MSDATTTLDHEDENKPARRGPARHASSVSVRDIARLTGVSAATVSNVINGRRIVSEATAAKIRAVMDQTNYQPTSKAIDTNRALLLVPNYPGSLLDDHVGPLHCSLVEAALNAGLCLSLRKCPDGLQSARELRQLLRQDGSQGIILLALRDGYHLADKLGIEHVPHVVAGASRHDHEVNQVVFDDTASARQATEYLLGLGHRRITIATFAREDIGHAQRYEGYREAMTRAGLPAELPPEMLAGFEADRATPEAGAEMMSKIAALPQRPTAVIVTNSRLAVGVLQRAQQLGLSVPKDLSIVGYDTSSNLTLTSPAITVMRTPCEDMGREAVRVLTEQLKLGGEIVHASRTTIFVNHRFEIHGSTAAPNPLPLTAD